MQWVTCPGSAGDQGRLQGLTEEGVILGALGFVFPLLSDDSLMEVCVRPPASRLAPPSPRRVEVMLDWRGTRGARSCQAPDVWASSRLGVAADRPGVQGCGGSRLPLVQGLLFLRVLSDLTQVGA